MRSITYAEYYDKVYGGWIGKCVGGNIGADVENNKYLMDLRENEIFPDQIPPNDDLDLQLLWLQVLERVGIHLTSRDLAEAWQQYCWYPFNEYGYFLHNFERGIDPPVSGWYNNQFFSQSMGSPIRSEIWGMIAVGNPALAMQYAELDATLDHDTESVWAEQMLAAMEAEAFFEADIHRLIEFGLSNIPEHSRLLQCIRYVIGLHADGVAWQEARQSMLRRFGDPDASKAVQNLGITILSLLYGGGDFGRTQLVALNCGYDTDCTCATAGAILGIISGAGKIPEEWKYQAEDTFVVGIDVQRPTDKISDLATDTCRVGVAMAQVLNGATAIVDVPAGLGVERINTAPPQTPVRVSVDYLGRPEIVPGVPKTLQLVVRNVGAERRALWLRLAAEGCVVNPGAVALDLGPGAAQMVAATVELLPAVQEYGAGLTVTVEWQEEGQGAVQAQVGLAVAQPWTVFGPFWDLVDTRSEEPFWDPVHRRKARPRGAENFNNYVNLDRAYVDEEALARGEAAGEVTGPVTGPVPGTVPGVAPATGGRVCYAAEHKLPIDAWMETAGPACLYLVQELVAPEARDVRLMVGNSDGFRIWVNGAVVGESCDPWYWMPYNHDLTVPLRAGSNRVVVKLIRRGQACDFSLGYAVPNTHVRWFNDLKTKAAR